MQRFVFVLFGMLQWGHRNSSVEIWTAAAGGSGARQASMGPPKFIGGNWTILDANDREIEASMGPPKFIGGNNTRCNPVENVLSRFNGATEIHRWKYRWR